MYVFKHEGNTMETSKFHDFKILIVEDDENLRFLFNEYFQFLNHCADFAVDGEDGKNKIESNKYDLIFMDIQMPKLTGEELIQKIRLQGIETPIIALTARSMKNDHIYYTDLGFNSVLSKPITLDTIKTKLDNFLKVSA